MNLLRSDQRDFLCARHRTMSLGSPWFFFFEYESWWSEKKRMFWEELNRLWKEKNADKSWCCSFGRTMKNSIVQINEWNFFLFLLILYDENFLKKERNALEKGTTSLLYTTYEEEEEMKEFRIIVEETLRSSRHEWDHRTSGVAQHILTIAEKFRLIGGKNTDTVVMDASSCDDEDMKQLMTLELRGDESATSWSVIECTLTQMSKRPGAHRSGIRAKVIDTNFLPLLHRRRFRTTCVENGTGDVESSDDEKIVRSAG